MGALLVVNSPRYWASAARCLSFRASSAWIRAPRSDATRLPTTRAMAQRITSWVLSDQIPEVFEEFARETRRETLKAATRAVVKRPRCTERHSCVEHRPDENGNRGEVGS